MRPFNYITVHSTHKPSWLIPPGYCTIEFVPVDDERTRVSIRLRLTKRDRVTLFATRLVAPKMLKREYLWANLERILPGLSGSASPSE